MLQDGQLIQRDTPQALIDAMQGKALVGNILRRENDVLLRIVGDTCPNGGTVVPPDPEVVYLYHFYRKSEEV